MSIVTRRLLGFALFAVFFSFFFWGASVEETRASTVKIQDVTSPGGIKAWLVEDHTLPVISISFSFQAGGAYDPPGKKGLASFVAGMLTEGCGTLNAKAFHETLQDYAIEIGFSSSKDRLMGSFRTTVPHKQKAFDLLKLVLTAPRFDSDQVAKLKAQTLATLLNLEKNPGFLAGKNLMKKTFPGHPYGFSTSGERGDIETLTSEDLKGFLKDRFSLDGFLIGVCGDITAKELGVILDQVFGTLPTKTTAKTIEKPTPVFDGGTTVIRTPHPQSNAYFMQSSHKFTHKDFMKMMILDHILGGGFETRLMQEVREKRGLAYSVSTNLVPYDKVGLWMGAVGTQNARMSESIDLIRKEWTRMRDRGVTAKELKDAKTYLVGRFPLNFTSTGQTASILHAYQSYGFKKSYINKRKERIQGVSLRDLNAFAKTFLKPEELSFVIVGDPEGFEDSGPQKKTPKKPLKSLASKSLASGDPS